jgi:hypothetical protein
MPSTLTNEQRFRKWVIVTPDHWIWKGAPESGGYGQTSVGGVRVMAHRWVWEWLVGPIPEGLKLDHTCRTTLCVNPAHLEQVTQLVNVQRGLHCFNDLRTTCVQGHDMTDPANRKKRDRGGYRCRECALESQRKHRRRAA